MHLTVRAVKPVESGCTGEVIEDGVLLARACEQTDPPHALTRLRAPLAPCVAADLENVQLSPEVWKDDIERWQDGCDLLLVETAGGLLSPMTWDYHAGDLARDLDARTLVVADNRLGCIHDVRAVIAYLRSQRTRVAAILLNDVESDGGNPSNLDAVRRLLPGTPAYSLPHDATGRSPATQETMRIVVNEILLP